MKSEANKKKVKYDKSYAMTPDQNEWYEAQIGSVLERCYPGVVWFIHVENGLVHITCPYLSREKGFIYSLQGLAGETPDRMRHLIMLAGGEILERFGISRVAPDLEQINNAKRNVRGDMTPDE